MFSGYRQAVNEVFWDFIHCRMVEQATENSSAVLVAISIKMMNVST